MKQQRCEVRECGATVLIADVEGRPVPVNPTRIEVVAADPEGRWRIVTGYQPHHATCVDIAARLSHRR